jgi:hypothetical protein
MCMIGCAGPTTPSKIRMYHSLVVAPAFLAICTIGPSVVIAAISVTEQLAQWQLEQDL